MSDDRPSPHGRLISVEIDATSIAQGPDEFLKEREAAVRDLIAENVFSPAGQREGRFRLKLSVVDRKLMLAISDADDTPVITHVLSLTPLRRVVKDYFVVCDAYYQAARTSTPSQIEAIDVGRRGLHNEGAEILQERLKGKVSLDQATARRLFTLVTALHRMT